MRARARARARTHTHRPTHRLRRRLVLLLLLLLPPAAAPVGGSGFGDRESQRDEAIFISHSTVDSNIFTIVDGTVKRASIYVDIYLRGLFGQMQRIGPRISNSESRLRTQLVERENRRPGRR